MENKKSKNDEGLGVFLKIGFVMVIVWIIYLFFFKVKEEKKEENLNFKVLEVVNADTIKINYNDKKTSLFTIGMNAPEGTECFSKQAKQKAKNILYGKEIKIEFDKSQPKFDKYGRLLSYVLFDDGKDFGLEMIKSGYAYEYTYKGNKYKNQKIYRDAQKYAEENKLGLWGYNTCNEKK